MLGKKTYPDLQIYGAHNQYVATRLEGYIHLSPNFQVPSTKDGVRWEGKEEILIKKLKEYLENSSLFGDKSEKKYNIINECYKKAEHFINLASNSLSIFKDTKEKEILKNLTSFSLARNF